MLTAAGYHFVPNTRISIRILLAGTYFLLLMLIAIFSFRHPQYNWDVLPYMAVIIRMEQVDPSDMHRLTYETAKESIPPAEYELLVGSEQRKALANDAALFQQQLPFYLVKPLYTGLVYLFHKLGFSLPVATVMPSILSYLLIGLLLLYWLNQFLTPFFAFAASLCIMYSDLLVGLAKLSTPDCLSALLILSAIYFIVQKASVWRASVFLVLAVFARLDNIITGVFFSSFLFFVRRWTKPYLLSQYLLLLAGLSVSYLAIGYLVRSFGWSVTYYPQFVSHLGGSHEYGQLPFAQRYISLVKTKIITAILHTHFIFFMLLWLLLIYPLQARWRSFSFEQLFSSLFLLVIGARFVLFPDLADRFFVPYYLGILILLIKTYVSRVKVTV